MSGTPQQWDLSTALQHSSSRNNLRFKILLILWKNLFIFQVAIKKSKGITVSSLKNNVLHIQRKSSMKERNPTPGDLVPDE